MSDTIRAGDLVFVLRGHCVHKVAGQIYRVISVEVLNKQTWCGHCGEACPIGTTVAKLTNDGHGFAPLSWLKKINPPPIEETLTTDEEVTA